MMWIFFCLIKGRTCFAIVVLNDRLISFSVDISFKFATKHIYYGWTRASITPDGMNTNFLGNFGYDRENLKIKNAKS